MTPAPLRFRISWKINSDPTPILWKFIKTPTWSPLLHSGSSTPQINGFRFFKCKWKSNPTIWFQNPNPVNRQFQIQILFKFKILSVVATKTQWMKNDRTCSPTSTGLCYNSLHYCYNSYRL